MNGKNPRFAGSHIHVLREDLGPCQISSVFLQPSISLAPEMNPWAFQRGHNRMTDFKLKLYSELWLLTDPCGCFRFVLTCSSWPHLAASPLGLHSSSCPVSSVTYASGDPPHELPRHTQITPNSNLGLLYFSQGI